MKRQLASLATPAALAALAVLVLCAGWQPAARADDVAGQTLFEKTCAACHQADASGTVGLAPPLRGAHWKALGRSGNYAATVVLKGLSGRIDVDGRPFIGSMPAFAAQFDDAQIIEVVAWLRSLQGIAPVSLSAQDVAQLRLASGNPAQTRELRQRLMQVP